MKQVFLILLLTISKLFLFSQEEGILKGTIHDNLGNTLPLVNIAVKGSPRGTASNDNGSFQLTVPALKNIRVGFSFIGYETVWKNFNLKKDEIKQLDIVLKIVASELGTIQIEDKYVRNTNLVRIDPRNAEVIVNPSDRVIALVKTQPGVISNNELSSQYSVRGGNFDENLIYVNDIEIYRPFLIHSGQQEGLSFINSDMVSSIVFSAGGFESKYGDKMSSVLDIKYRTPTQFNASITGSLLGSSIFVENASENNRFSFLMGLRYKTNQYLLKSLDTKGEYNPRFIDWQGMFNYQISEKFSFSFLGDYSNNNFRFKPVSRETDFGTAMDVKRVTIYFEGQEADQYLIYFGSGTMTYRPNTHTNIKLIATAFTSTESERYDILGEYWIGKVSTDIGSENYDKVIQTEGVGAYLNHARNQLNINVKRLKIIGRWQHGNSFLQWGARIQNEQINDHINEWRMIDSSSYALPHAPDSVGYTDPSVQPDYNLEITERLFSNYQLKSQRLTAFVQNTWGVDERINGFSATLGLRSHYWTSNEELLFSPRASLSYKPNWEKDVVIRLSGGLYYQPPFYRELKNINGGLNPTIKAQSSIQVVLGSDYNFRAWNRDFKLVTEAYYKYFNNLIPYTIDNVRIRYYGNDKAKGYAKGIDVKINGEFVKGVESWASISLMKTEEDIEGDFGVIDGNYTEIGFIPRPTDRLVSISLFFQDYLPFNPTYRASLMGTFSTGMPFGPPNSPRYLQVYTMNPYLRFDFGFTKEIVGPNSRKFKKGIFQKIESLMLTAEVLNLFNSYNTSGYTWVTDVNRIQYPVPNYLTPRLFNLSVLMKI